MSARKVKDEDRYKQTGSDYQIYSDFDQSFLPHPFTGQITRRTNVDAVKMSIRNLILTNKYERLRNPEFGGNVRRYLFENFSTTVGGEIEDQVRSIITSYEPRARVLDVIVTPDENNNSIDVTIVFSVITSQDRQEINLTLYRVR